MLFPAWFPQGTTCLAPPIAPLRRATLRQVLLGVADGTRTRDSRDHNPGLYQLSYGHRAKEIVAEGLPFSLRACSSVDRAADF